MSLIDAVPTRRERKKDATRAAIHLAALSLTEELGLAGVTVEAITERADVAPRTFFNYFPSKLHAVLGRDPGRAARLHDALERRLDDESPLVALRAVLLEDFLPDHRTGDELLRRFRVVRTDPTLLAALHAEFEDSERAMMTAVARRTGQQPETDVYPRLVVSVALSAMRVALVRWCEGGGVGSLALVVDEAFDHLATGLVAPNTKDAL